MLYRTWNRRLIMMALPSLIAFVICIPPLVNVWGSFSFGPNHVICDIFHSEDGYEIFYSVTITTISFPILGISYTSIIYKVMKSRKQIRTSYRSSYSGETTKSKNERQLVTNIIVMIAVFSILYIPEAIMPILDHTHTTENLNEYIHIAASYIGWIHVIVNPLIYTLFNTKIKRASIKLLCVCNAKQSSNSCEVSTIT